MFLFLFLFLMEVIEVKTIDTVVSRASRLQ